MNYINLYFFILYNKLSYDGKVKQNCANNWKGI